MILLDIIKDFNPGEEGRKEAIRELFTIDASYVDAYGDMFYDYIEYGPEEYDGLYLEAFENGYKSQFEMDYEALIKKNPDICTEGIILHLFEELSESDSYYGEIQTNKKQIGDESYILVAITKGYEG